MKNRILTLVTFMVGLLFLQSCIKDNLDDCSKSIRLSLKYTADGTTNVIEDYLEQGTIYLYEKSSGVLVDQFQFSKEDVKARSFLLDLPVGEFTLVAWGNMTNRSEIKNLNNISEARLASEAYYRKAALVGNDPLYFSRLDIQVNRSEVYELNFKSAHVKFDVLIDGLVSGIPSLKISNLVPELDMNMQFSKPSTELYLPKLNVESSKTSIRAQFNVLKFEDISKINLTIEPKIGDIVHLNLESFLKAQDMLNYVMNNQEVRIPIRLKYNSLGVIVEVPQWNEETSIPGIE